MQDKMKTMAETVGKAAVAVYKALKHFFLKTSLGQCLGMAAMLVVILEILGFRSLLQGLAYPFTHPLSYCINTLLVALTFAVAVPFKRRYFGYMLVLVLWLAAGIVNFVLLGMRVTPFEAADLYIITTGFSIVTIYLKVWQIVLIAAAILLGIAVLVVAFIKMPKTKSRTLKDCLISMLSLSVVTVSSILCLRGVGIIPRTVSNIADAYLDYGFAYCFSMGFVDRGINEPASYNAELIDEISGLIGEEQPRPEKTPNVIFVQLESFFDVNRLKDYEYSENPIPNFTKLAEQYPSGHITVPSIGAGTANTEFEVLTGMSLDYFGMGEYPYKSVLRENTCESLATMFKDYGYTAHALHNHSGSFYKRHIVYPNLGFDSYTSSEYMPNIERNALTWAKDAVLTEEIVKALDSTEKTADFVFAVSVQGHGRYPTEELDYEKHVQILAGPTTDTQKCRYEYYVNQLYEMDRFIASLTEAVTARQEETVIVFYGDHLPSLEITDDMLSSGTLYETEYVIWSNFEPRKTLPDRDLTAYQLSSYAMRQIDFTVGVMNRFHNYYLDRDDYHTEIWDRHMHALQYDMLYGNYYIYGAVNPFEKSDMRMGIVDITVSSCRVDGEQATVKGRNFTESSVVYVNGEAVETQYVSSTELQVMEGQELVPGAVITVVQVASDLTELSASKEYTVP